MDKNGRWRTKRERQWRGRDLEEKGRVLERVLMKFTLWYNGIVSVSKENLKGLSSIKIMELRRK